MLLKPNMAISGAKAPKQASVAEVAQQTLRLFKRTVPAAVPGIVFLSGGQSDEAATAHLNAMNRLGPLPWKLSFSYGRALQSPSLNAWRGDPANVPAAQAALAHRARMNGLARTGAYTAAQEGCRRIAGEDPRARRRGVAGEAGRMARRAAVRGGIVAHAAPGTPGASPVLRAARRNTTPAMRINVVDTTSISVPMAFTAGVGDVFAAP